MTERRHIDLVNTLASYLFGNISIERYLRRSLIVEEAENFLFLNIRACIIMCKGTNICFVLCNTKLDEIQKTIASFLNVKVHVYCESILILVPFVFLIRYTYIYFLIIYLFLIILGTYLSFHLLLFYIIPYCIVTNI